MQKNGRIFGAEYYETCTEFRGGKKRWLCNTNLSPIKPATTQQSRKDIELENMEPQDNIVQIYNFSDSSDEIIPDTPDYLDCSAEEEDSLFLTSYKNPENDGGEINEVLLDSSKESGDESEENDSIDDPDFIPGSSDEGDDDIIPGTSYEKRDAPFLMTLSACEDHQYPETQVEVQEENEQTNIVEFCRKGNKGKDYCFFCEDLVLNFSRHIQRNHTLEAEVQQILLLPAGCSERKSLLSKLRKKGNYLNSQAIRKPVKKSYLTNSETLPCTNCLGFYSAKQLWRHNKLCNGSTSNAKSKSQNLLIKIRVDPVLREKVFPKMRPDKISLKAKTDVLICAFGARYIKVHRELHFINVASRKMRELARLLIEVQILDDSIKNLFDALNPTKFDILVNGTKIVAKYDTDNDYYKSPTYALNIGTSLKQCCEIAITFALKRKEVYATINAASAEADLRTMIQLLEAHWKFEISIQAANDLNVKKWNKVTIVPLANDLRILREYFKNLSNKVMEAFSNDTSNKTLYLKMIEIVFCKVLILNRRRPGELQRLPLHLYVDSSTQSTTYEEFSEVISPAEKVLMKTFKRIVVKGKRSRGVPVLFSSDVQKEIEILLKHRDTFLSKKNTYLFGNPNTLEPISGYKTLKKHVESSAVQNPKALTATRLRKHLATLCQIFSMTDNDIEQLSTFMGHTTGIHRQNYRLPDDVYQCSKITKLLLLMEKGEAAQYKGKSLDEIKINLDDDLLTDITNTGRDEKELEPNEISEKESLEDRVENTKLITKKGKRILTPWTCEQKATVVSFFKHHIKQKKSPKKSECDVLLQRHPDLLSNKSWLKIKVFVQNLYSKKK